MYEVHSQFGFEARFSGPRAREDANRYARELKDSSGIDAWVVPADRDTMEDEVYPTP